jgi:hypothetical protein
MRGKSHAEHGKHMPCFITQHEVRTQYTQRALNKISTRRKDLGLANVFAILYTVSILLMAYQMDPSDHALEEAWPWTSQLRHLLNISN